ncbi:hypothetical protein K501DRAFT_11658 [Backusella circina FSU 941]|nr:hypothetical protein K501DRAFT_11658 [Backusella circina FSU 941]
MLGPFFAFLFFFFKKKKYIISSYTFFFCFITYYKKINKIFYIVQSKYIILIFCFKNMY